MKVKAKEAQFVLVAGGGRLMIVPCSLYNIGATYKEALPFE